MLWWVKIINALAAFNELGKCFLHLFIKNMASWYTYTYIGGLTCPVGGALNGRSCHCAKVA